MHVQARAWIAQQVQGRTFGSVIEIGGRDINGGVRDLIDAASYTSLDLYEGPGVDVVADATTWTPDLKVDLVICCEVLEHAADPEMVVRSALYWLKSPGLFLMTCATDPRKAHSAHDGGELRGDEHYGNVAPFDFLTWVRTVKPNCLASATIYPDRGDLYGSVSV